MGRTHFDKVDLNSIKSSSGAIFLVDVIRSTPCTIPYGFPNDQHVFKYEKYQCKIISAYSCRLNKVPKIGDCIDVTKAYVRKEYNLCKDYAEMGKSRSPIYDTFEGGKPIATGKKVWFSTIHFVARNIRHWREWHSISCVHTDSDRFLCWSKGVCKGEDH